MMQTLKFQPQQVEANDYAIETQLTQEGLKINLQRKQGLGTLLTGRVSRISDDDKIQNAFESLEDLNKYLIEDKGFKVDGERKLLTILFKVGTRKEKLIKIAEIPLEIAEVDYNRDLNRVLSKFGHSNSVSFLDVKQAIYKIASSLTHHLKIEESQLSTVAQPLKIKSPKKNKENSIEKIKDEYIKYSELRLEINEVNKKLDRLLLPQKDELHKIAKSFDEQLRKTQADLYKMAESTQNLTKIILSMPSYPAKLLNNLSEINFPDEEEQQAEIDLLDNIKQSPLSVMDEQAKQKGDDNLQIKNGNSNQAKKQFMLVEWLDDEVRVDGKVRIKQNSMTTLNCTAKIFSKVRITGIYSYTIKILSLTKSVIVGVIDAAYKNRTNFKSCLTNNYISYSSNGNFFDGRTQTQYTEFKEGNKVTVTVNCIAGSIQWKTEERVLLKTYEPKLREQIIQWSLLRSHVEKIYSRIAMKIQSHSDDDFLHMG